MDHLAANDNDDDEELEEGELLDDDELQAAWEFELEVGGKSIRTPRWLALVAEFSKEHAGLAQEILKDIDVGTVMPFLDRKGPLNAPLLYCHVRLVSIMLRAIGRLSYTCMQISTMTLTVAFSWLGGKMQCGSLMTRASISG